MEKTYLNAKLQKINLSQVYVQIKCYYLTENLHSWMKTQHLLIYNWTDLGSQICVYRLFNNGIQLDSSIFFLTQVLYNVKLFLHECQTYHSFVINNLIFGLVLSVSIKFHITFHLESISRNSLDYQKYELQHGYIIYKTWLNLQKNNYIMIQ